jgi:hypothetical protein
MPKNDLAQQLHNQATCGGKLSPEERAQLDEWYAQQDREEGAILFLHASQQTNATLRAQVDNAIAQLRNVAECIQTLMAENDKVRGEIAALQHRLTQTAKP